MGEKKPKANFLVRLKMLASLFVVAGFGLVGLRLLYMQVFHHDFYIQKATSLQTRDTFITPNRGKIYDANMQVLAESAEVERITVSPKGVVSETKEKQGVSADTQRQTLATILSETLSVSYDSVMEKLNKTDSEYEIIAQKVDKDVSKELDEKLDRYNLSYETVAPKNEQTIKKFQKQKLYTDTGIEITIPMEEYRNPDHVEFITNMDGTISVLIKNIGMLSSK